MSPSVTPTISIHHSFNTLPFCAPKITMSYPCGVYFSDSLQHQLKDCRPTLGRPVLPLPITTPLLAAHGQRKAPTNTYTYTHVHTPQCADCSWSRYSCLGPGSSQTVTFGTWLAADARPDPPPGAGGGAATGARAGVAQGATLLPTLYCLHCRKTVLQASQRENGDIARKEQKTSTYADKTTEKVPEMQGTRIITQLQSTKRRSMEIPDNRIALAELTERTPPATVDTAQTNTDLQPDTARCIWR